MGCWLNCMVLFGCMGRNAQCADQVAPWVIHCLRSSISCCFSLRLVVGGGMILLSSLDVMTCIIALFSVDPGVTGFIPLCSANRPSRVSSLMLASLVLASGPWHAKQYSDRMGLIWRSKSIILSACRIDADRLNTITSVCKYVRTMGLLCTIGIICHAFCCLLVVGVFCFFD